MAVAAQNQNMGSSSSNNMMMAEMGGGAEAAESESGGLRIKKGDPVEVLKSVATMEDTCWYPATVADFWVEADDQVWVLVTMGDGHISQRPIPLGMIRPVPPPSCRKGIVDVGYTVEVLQFPASFWRRGVVVYCPSYYHPPPQPQPQPQYQPQQQFQQLHLQQQFEQQQQQQNDPNFYPMVMVCFPALGSFGTYPISSIRKAMVYLDHAWYNILPQMGIPQVHDLRANPHLVYQIQLGSMFKKIRGRPRKGNSLTSNPYSSPITIGVSNRKRGRPRKQNENQSVAPQAHSSSQNHNVAPRAYPSSSVCVQA